MNPETTMTEIAERIHQRRTELGYSYQDLADLTGMNRSSLHRYETGSIGNIPLHRVETLAAALQCSPEWLMGWDTGEDIHLTISDTDPQMEALTQTARHLNAQGLQKLVDLADDLVASGKYEKQPLNQELVTEYRKQFHNEESTE